MSDAISREALHEDARAHLIITKAIIKPWEDLIRNKNRSSLGYENDETFHTLDYSKPI